MLPGETIQSGAPPRCPDCHEVPRLDVYQTPAGHYIGTWCACGPYTRESGYYRSREAALAALTMGTFHRE